MSSSNKCTTKKSVVATPYCATCHKAGEPLSAYTGHWTKSSPGPEGVVVCPLILNSVCTYCRKSGHFKKFCPVLVSRQSTQVSGTVSGPVLVDDDCSSVGSIGSVNSVKSDMLKRAINVSGPALVSVPDSGPVNLDKYNYTKKNQQVTSKGADPVKSGYSTPVRETPVSEPPVSAAVVPSDNIVYFSPVTPDTTPPSFVRKHIRRLWADMDDEEE